MTHERGRESWIERRGLFALLLMPLAVLALDDNLFFGGPHRDAWIYYGYFQDGIDYLRRFPDYYYGSRLSVIVPGYLAVHLLPPVAANLALRLVLVWTTLACFWTVARARCGSRAALLAGFALVGYPYYFLMEGWNYVDGFGVAYFAVAMACASRHRSSGASAWLVGAGLALSAMVTANLLYLILVPIVLWELAGDPLVRSRWRTAGGVALGALLGAAGCAGVYWVVAGSPNYLRASLQFGTRVLTGAQSNLWRLPLLEWLPRADHLVVPIALLLAAAIGLARHRGVPEQHARALYAAFAAAVVLAQWSGRNIAQMFYGASLLMLPAFWALGAHWAATAAPLPPRRFSALAMLAGAAALGPYALAPLADRLPVDLPLPVLLAIACGAAVAALLRPGWAASVATVASLALVSVLLRAQLDWRSDLRGRARELYVQMDGAFRAIDDNDPERRARLWYDFGEPHGLVLDGIASAFLLCPRMVGNAFPAIEGGQMCDGSEIAPGALLVVLSERADAESLARRALAGLGFDARSERELAVPGPAAELRLRFLRVVVAATASGSKSSR